MLCGYNLHAHYFISLLQLLKLRPIHPFYMIEALAGGVVNFFLNIRVEQMNSHVIELYDSQIHESSSCVQDLWDINLSGMFEQERILIFHFLRLKSYICYEQK